MKGVLSAALVSGWLCLIGGPAEAQVTVNPHALDDLDGGGAAPTPQKPAAHPAPSHPAPTRHPAAPHAPAQTPPHVTPAKPAAPPRPVVPPVPPPPVVLQPLSPPPPAHPTELPPPAPVVANAVGVATPITGGLRITFGPGSADLNAATSEALRQLARAMPTGVFTLNAYTPGQPDDPSTPRRLSLDRALATRSLLMAEGIPSTRIIARGHQFGPNEPDGPADRVDITVTLPPPIKP